MKRTTCVICATLAASLTGCVATKGDVTRLEAKVDQILMSTRQAALEEVFGNFADRIRIRLEELSDEDRARYEGLMASYERGELTISKVREDLGILLGSGDREVSTQSGIYVRTLDGARRPKAIARGTKISDSVRLEDYEIPSAIKSNPKLAKYGWGRGQIAGETVIFPWDFTISGLSKEIVEATARRTAEEFLRMGGSVGSNRPVQIQIVTDQPQDLEIVAKEGADEVVILDPRTPPAP